MNHWKQTILKINKSAIFLIIVNLSTYSFSQIDSLSMDQVEFSLNDDFSIKKVFYEDKLFTGILYDKIETKNVYYQIKFGEIKTSKTYVNNKLIQQRKYEYGGFNSEKNYSMNGNIISEGVNYLDLKHGKWNYYYDTKELKSIEFYNKGIECKKWTYFDINGREIMSVTFDNRIPSMMLKKYKNDTIQFSSLKKTFEKCPKEFPKNIDRIHPIGSKYDSIQYCNNVYYYNKNKYFGYAQTSKNDSLFFLENGRLKFLKIIDKNILIKYISLNDRGYRQGNYFELYPTQKIKTQGFYENGSRSGYWKDFYNNGVIQREYRYLYDSPLGWWEYYSPDGKHAKTEIYDQQRQLNTIGFIEYDKSGNTITSYYDNSGEINFKIITNKFGEIIESVKYKDNQFIGILD